MCRDYCVECALVSIAWKDLGFFMPTCLNYAILEEIKSSKLTSAYVHFLLGLHTDQTAVVCVCVRGWGWWGEVFVCGCVCVCIAHYQTTTTLAFNPKNSDQNI